LSSFSFQSLFSFFLLITFYCCHMYLHAPLSFPLPWTLYFRHFACMPSLCHVQVTLFYLFPSTFYPRIICSSYVYFLSQLHFFRAYASLDIDWQKWGKGVTQQNWLLILIGGENVFPKLLGVIWACR
jgi:hypothetical protein